jgi:hypothetical protein
MEINFFNPPIRKFPKLKIQMIFLIIFIPLLALNIVRSVRSIVRDRENIRLCRLLAMGITDFRYLTPLE